MAAPPWLYKLARGHSETPKPARHNKKAGRKNGAQSSDFPLPLSSVMQSSIDRLHLQPHLQAFENKVHDVSVHVGMEHVPPQVLILSFLGFFFTVMSAYHVVRKIRKKAWHKKRFGENSFPPFAPYGVRDTTLGLSSVKLPWFFKESAERVGPIFRLNIPSLKDTNMLVAVGDLETAKEILQDPRTVKPETSNIQIRALAGAPNIFTSDGHQWKTSRNGVAPAFDKRYVDRMNRVCKEQTEDWIQRELESFLTHDEPFDLNQQFGLLTIAILCKAAFEYRIKDDEAKMLVEEFDIALRDTGFDNFNTPFLSCLGFVFASVRRVWLARKRVRALASKILSTYRNTSKHKRSQETTILSCIVNNTKYKDDTHRIADMVMFLYAGYETTSNSLSWTFLELARNPEELKRLRNALNGSDDFFAQTILKDIIRESMRLRPVLPDVGLRMTGRDFYLRDQAIVIPKGSQVIFPTILLTRYEVEDAEEFLPSRWSEHAEKSFLLFSNGRRNCVGQGLALSEIAWVLSRLCAKYDFEVADEGATSFPATRKCEGAKLKARRVENMVSSS
jgi:cytochrome P450